MEKKETILVTGADGFIGSHLVELLLESGYRVRALSQYNSFNNWGWLENINVDTKNLEVVTGDVRDSHFCLKLTESIDIVFHLAALIAIPFSYVAPEFYIDTNVKGTLNICEAARRNGVKRIVHTSTSEVYGTAKYVPIDEAHPKQPQSPYSASKIGADAIAMSFYSSFGLPLVVARPFNTFGPRQSARAIIPTIITQILTGKKEIKLGDLSPKRDFTFVKDTCRGLLSLALCDDCLGREINISSNFEISIAEALDTIKSVMKSDVEFIVDEQRIRPASSEVYRLWGDNNLINKLTGYKPKFTFEEGIRQTVEWFKKGDNIKYYKPEIYNV